MNASYTTDNTSNRRKLLLLPGPNGGFTIDEDDYRVISDMALGWGFDDIKIEIEDNNCYDNMEIEDDNYDNMEKVDAVLNIYRDGAPHPHNIAYIGEDDEERRVYYLNLPYDIESIPTDIGKLTNLTHLDLGESDNIRSLPDFIGKLTNLTHLDLVESKITSLPSSIGRLQNLEVLDLGANPNLSELPEEIWNLASLNVLRLTRTKITLLPPSIGRLHNLYSLDLDYTKNLLELPEEIGNLTNLKDLRLRYSVIASLPNSIERLTGLTNLRIFGSCIPELKKKDPNDFLLMLVQRCRSLSSLDKELVEGNVKLGYALTCNGARSRTSFGTTDEESVRVTPKKLWPLMLNNATRAYNSHFFDWIKQPYQYQLTKPDAIYQLLVDGRESFLGRLLDRNTHEAGNV